MRKKITKEFIDATFESCQHQTDVVITFYKFVFGNDVWDTIERLEGHPAIGEEANKYIFKKFFDFDKKHHPSVIPGGAWLNWGFSTYEAKSLGLGPWEVSTEGCPVIYRKIDEADLIIRQRSHKKICLNCGD